MRTFQQIIEEGDSFEEFDFNPNLILVFASRQLLEKDELMEVMRKNTPIPYSLVAVQAEKLPEKDLRKTPLLYGNSF